MKKQFFRVKQLADQTFSRASKTEALSDDLQEADRKVEYIRTACQNTSKKIASSLLGQGQDAASKDKRLKKCPEYNLGLAMQDSGSSDEDCLLRTILSECGKAEIELAKEIVEHDLKVEELVMTRLHQMLDPEIPNILKHKRNLAKLTLDMDSARTRHQTAIKHSHTATGTSTRVESIKEELEDAELKVEQCRDQIASEMFQLLSREADLAQVIVQYAKLQRAYHESAFRMLEGVIPELEKSINSSCSKPVYGYRLESHLEVTGRKVAFPIELCVCALLQLGMEEEGLFRVAGGASKLRRMKLSFDACCLTLQTALEYRDPHVIAGALKSYLRELPEPLLTFDLYDEWMAAARIQNVDTRLQALWQAVQKLPQANFDNLHYLIKFLAALSKNQSVNKMTPQNIAIVIAPNLIWSPANETNTIGMNMNSANMYSVIVDSLVSNADWFFPGELDFYQTLSRESAGLLNGMTTSPGSLTCGTQPTEHIGSYPAERSHVRSSSGEGQLINLNEGGDMKRTQSSSSLSDHSSPTQGSPKPATRRKNKPAPVPPSTSTVTHSFTAATTMTTTTAANSTTDKPEKPPRPVAPLTTSTLPRPSKKVSDPLFDVKTNTNENTMFITAEKHNRGTTGFDGSRLPSGRRSSESDHHQNVLLSHPKAVPDQDKTVDEVFSLNAERSPVPSKHSVTPGTEGKVSVSTQADAYPPKIGGYSSSTLERKRPIPVAAPRSILNVNATVTVEGNKNASISSKTKGEGEGLGLNSVVDDGVVLRNKPAIPERPPTLVRPQSSFRGSRQSAELDNSSGDKVNSDSERPMLERTHMYSVDKQQVSIIQVGGEKEKTVPVPNNNNDLPLLQRSPSVGSRPLFMSCTEKEVSMEKPERPPKPEALPETYQSSHSRTRSEGNICDIDTMKPAVRPLPHLTSLDNPAPSLKTPSRPPRPPQMPPAPPKAKNENSYESTDL